MIRLKGRQAFTLIELLVVIAIIALLASILFPVFTAAKRSSYQAVCASNLGQFGKAFLMYADDWGGRLPIPTGAGDSSTCWLNDSIITDSAGNRLHIQNGALWPYIRTRLRTGQSGVLWSCPLAAPASATSATGFSLGANYIMNDYIRAKHYGEYSGSWNNGGDPMCLCGMVGSSSPTPSHTILLFEGVQYADGSVYRGASPFYLYQPNPMPSRANVHPWFKAMGQANLPQNYHHGMSDFLFLDGHVKLMDPALTVSQATYDTHSSGHFVYWKNVYTTAGNQDLWNPHVADVTYP